MKKIKTGLEVLCYAVVIAFCGISIYNGYFGNSSQNDPNGMPFIKAGEKHEALADVVHLNKKATVILALSDACPFCNESLPFFKTLIEERNKTNEDIAVITAVGHSRIMDNMDEVLKRNELEVDGLVNLDFAALKITGVPAVILVDNEGEVQRVWRGKPSAQYQKEILKIF